MFKLNILFGTSRKCIILKNVQAFSRINVFAETYLMQVMQVFSNVFSNHWGFSLIWVFFATMLFSILGFNPQSDTNNYHYILWIWQCQLFGAAILACLSKSIISTGYYMVVKSNGSWSADFYRMRGSEISNSLRPK